MYKTYGCKAKIHYISKDNCYVLEFVDNDDEFINNFPNKSYKLAGGVCYKSSELITLIMLAGRTAPRFPS